MARTEFNVWGWAQSRAAARNMGMELRQKRPDLDFVVLPADSTAVPERKRYWARKDGASHVVGVWSDYGPPVRIRGLNA